MKTKKPPSRVVDARYVASASAVEQLPPPVGVEIAFAGRSNVGKSSLLNALMGRKSLARTSRTPGCTRQISFFEARTDDGALLTLVDLPGYGYAKRSKAERHEWAGLIEGYLLGRPTLKAVAVLVDARRGAEEEERGLLELIAQPPTLSRNPLAVLVVATKLDKLPVSGHKLAVQKIGQALGHRALGFSTQDPVYATQLLLAVRRAMGLVTEAPPTAARDAADG